MDTITAVTITTEEKGWQTKWPWDEGRGKELRGDLIFLNLFPYGKITGDPMYDKEEIYKRNEIKDIIDHLSREDLVAVYELCRLLVNEPDVNDEAIRFAHSYYDQRAEKLLKSDCFLHLTDQL